jgi:LuxR family maltose regulon positive regulatory protein
METVVRELDMLPWIMDGFSGWKIRVWLKQNRLDDAMLWVKERNLDIDGDITSVNEASFRALARILLARNELDKSLRLLQQLWERAEVGGRTSIMIETLILQAIVLQEKGEPEQALSKLERALTLAEPGGFIRTFVDEGPPMASLLYEALNRGMAAGYVRRLLAAFPPVETAEPGAESARFPITDPPSALIEPLSDRELEVLQLIAEGLSNREIAGRLYLSLNTVKVHARNIYGKLSVHNRVQAVARARELAILPPV